MTPLFEVHGRRVAELPPEHLPRLQAFFDANPEYEQIVNGRPPPPDAAVTDYAHRPPPHLASTWHGYLGVYAADDALDGAIVLDRDLGAPGVWHLALFIVATRLHASGFAQALYDALERWVAGQGAPWLRLNVLVANPRARAFWNRQGFRPVRLREGIDTGVRLHDSWVMLKPLAGGTLDAYLDLVPRDRPGSTLP